MLMNESDYLMNFPFTYCSVNDVFDDKNIKIYYESMKVGASDSRFVMFCGEVLFGVISFPTEVSDDDVINISKAMVKEFLLFNEECNGEIFEFDRVDDFNFINTREDWNRIYGKGSINHKKFLQKKLILDMKEFFKYNREDVLIVDEVIEYFKEFCPKKCRRLFK